MDDFNIVIDGKECPCAKRDKVYIEIDNSAARNDAGYTERYDITIDQALADARNMFPKFEDISLTGDLTYTNDTDDYLRVLEWLKRLRQTNIRP